MEKEHVLGTCRMCHWHKRRLDSGQALAKALISPVSSSVMMTLGPASLPLPPKAPSGRRAFRSDRPASRVVWVWFESTKKPRGRPPAGLSVRNFTT